MVSGCMSHPARPRIVAIQLIFDSKPLPLSTLNSAPAVPVPSTGELPVIALRQQVAGLVNVSPLTLSEIADGADAPAVTLASLLKRVSAIFESAPTFAASLTLTRRDQLNADFDLNAALSYAIASGIAQTVDRVLLQSLAAIPTNAVPSIDFGRFAAANVDAQQLRALVGPQHDNSGGLVTFRPDGQLVAGGVIAATGLVLVLVRPGEAPEGARSELRLAPALGELVLSGRF